MYGQQYPTPVAAGMMGQQLYGTAMAMGSGYPPQQIRPGVTPGIAAHPGTVPGMATAGDRNGGT